MVKENQELARWANEIAAVARNFGLDFYPVRFEICPAETIYTFGAYGMPVRFTHWSFGKAFYRLKMHYDLNLSRIYELVVNSNPAYAFLLEGNSLLQNKLVMGHVYAHVDFFKNNRYFARTPKDMVERMTAHAEQIREFELKFGRELVEKTLDALLAINEHVDSRAHLACKVGQQDNKPATNQTKHEQEQRRRLNRRNSPYQDLWLEEEEPGQEPYPAREWEDLLLYLIKFAPGLTDWQKDLAGIVREESLYFYPQLETKVINEGWATFWHARIMRELDLADDELLDFAAMHSGIIQPTRWRLNPYYLGVKIWEDLAQRHSLLDLLETREIENDVSFVRNYLNRELIEDLNLFSYRKVGAQWQVSATDWEKVRDDLVQRLVNGGNPRIVVVKPDFDEDNSLILKHCHEGQDLDVGYLEKTLTLVQYLWGRAVKLETVLDTKKATFTCQNGLVTRAHPS